MKISTYDFNQNQLNEIKSKSWGMKWPVVYILNSKKEAYVGETIKCCDRMDKHLRDSKRKDIKKINIIYDEKFNKSAVIDIESFLIRYMTADGKYILQNENNGIQNHNYYDRKTYLEMYKDIWKELNKKGLIRNSIKKIENKNIFKYSPYKELTDDQFLTAVSIFRDLSSDDSIETFIVNGGAGTGKSVLAVYMIKLIQYVFSEEYSVEGELDEDNIMNDLLYLRNKKNLKVALVVPMQSFRKTLKKVFKGVSGLSPNMVIGPSQVIDGDYDLLIVDEAHRLRKKENITGFQHKQFKKNNDKLGLPEDSTELDWIIKCSDNQILFYDEDQSIKNTDVSVIDFKSLQKKSSTKKYDLSSQLRILGGKDYIDYVKKILTKKVKRKEEFENYEFLLFDHVDKMVNEIKKKEKKFELCRVVAGYSWKWNTKNLSLDYINENNLFDIEIRENRKKPYRYIWNSQDTDWVNSENALNEIGCIHTVQGYDLNYAGVIIGNELTYDKEKDEIVIHKENYYDMNGKKKTSDKELKEYIIHIYKVLLTRGIRGTYVYACDRDLHDYLKKFISEFNGKKKEG